MPDTLTPHLKLTNQTEGGNDNTWGTIADANFEEIDDKFGDVTSVSTTGGTTTLTDAQEIVNAIHVSGTLVSNATIVFSGRGGTWVVRNTTTGAFTVTCKVSGQTGVTVTQGTAKIVYSTGTDIADTGSTDIVNDTTPQLGGDLDANTFDIQFDDATGIRDDSDNEQLIFQKTASAINHLEITNAAAGGSPSLAAVGDDTNIDLTLAGKGTGGVVGRFKQATGLGLLDSDSSHALRLKTSSNLAADRTLDLVTGDADRTVTLAGNLTTTGGNVTLPTGTALVQANNLSDVAVAATAFANIKQAASDTATGAIEIATQAELETPASALLAVTPARQHFHPGHPKAGGMLVGTGTPAFAAGDYGMGAVTDVDTGEYTLALDTAFANTNYWVTTSVRNGTSNRCNALHLVGSKTESLITVQAALGDDSDQPFDPAEAGITFWGDYA